MTYKYNKMQRERCTTSKSCTLGDPRSNSESGKLFVKCDKTIGWNSQGTKHLGGQEGKDLMIGWAEIEKNRKSYNFSMYPSNTKTLWSYILPKVTTCTATNHLLPCGHFQGPTNMNRKRELRAISNLTLGTNLKYFHMKTYLVRHYTITPFAGQ